MLAHIELCDKGMLDFCHDVLLGIGIQQCVISWPNSISIIGVLNSNSSDAVDWC